MVHMSLAKRDYTRILSTLTIYIIYPDQLINQHRLSSTVNKSAVPFNGCTPTIIMGYQSEVHIIGLIFYYFD